MGEDRIKLKREIQKIYEETMGAAMDMDKVNRMLGDIKELSYPAVAGVLKQAGQSGGYGGYDCDEIVSIGLQKIFIEAILEKQMNYQPDKGYFADFAVGVMKNCARNYLKGVRKRNDREESMYWEFSEGCTYETILADIRDGEAAGPEQEVLKKEQEKLYQDSVGSFMEIVVHSREIPFRLLAMCYVKLYAPMMNLAFHYNPHKWAELMMKDKDLRELSMEFLKKSNSELDYICLEWGEDFESSMKSGYHKGCRDFEILEKVVFTKEFTRKDIENWSERVCKKLVMQWMKIVSENQELADALVRYTEHRPVANAR